MALLILDGNQSATTLSTILTGGAHIPAHTVVSFGSQAITDIGSAVSGVELGPNTLAALENITVTVGSVTVTGGLTDAQLRATPVTIGGDISILGTPSVTFGQSTTTFGAITGSISVLNFPASQTIAGTVTANVEFDYISGADCNGASDKGVLIGWRADDDSFKVVDNVTNPLPISGTVTVGNTTTSSAVFTKICGEIAGAGPSEAKEIITDSQGMLYARIAPSTSLSVEPVKYDPVLGDSYINVKPYSGSAITISNLPASQTVTGTVELGPTSLNALESITVTMGQVVVTGGLTDAQLRASVVTIGGTVTANGIAFNESEAIPDKAVWIGINNNGTLEGLGSANPLPISGTVTANADQTSLVNALNEYATNYSETWPVSVLNLPAISGTITVGAVPNGSLTTRFGTPTTAGTAFATSAVTNASRKYLLIQNVTTGSNVITVGIGFTPTTTQGIQLVAGAGITFESSYIPTGAVYVLSSVTASNFTILEA